MDAKPNLFIVAIEVQDQMIRTSWGEGYLLFLNKDEAEDFILNNPPTQRAQFEDDGVGNSFGPPPEIVSFVFFAEDIVEQSIVDSLSSLFEAEGVRMAFVENIAIADTNASEGNVEASGT